jgi:hypothetical protein
MTMPTAISSTASATLATATIRIFPTKYDGADIGVPRSRISVPSSRSSATPMPRLRNDVATIPAPSMLAPNTCPTETPLGYVSSKIEPRRIRMNAGKVKVKITWSFCRKNCFSSTPPLERPTPKVDGRAAVVIGALRSVPGRCPPTSAC